MVPFKAKEVTVLSAFGFQLVALPVPESMAAIKLRVDPPIEVKLPPAYTVLLVTSKALTPPLLLGFHEVAVPETEAVFKAAIKLRADPPIFRN